MTNRSTRKVRSLEEAIVPPAGEDLIHYAATVACDRISSELAEGFRHLRKQLCARCILITVLVALLSCLGSSVYVLLVTHRYQSHGLLGYFGMAVVATLASLFTIIGLYPVLRKSEHYLYETASIGARANIELLCLLGKLTELQEGDTAAGHTLRVTVCTILFAEALQVPRDTLVRAVKGALLHDIGKLVMPDRVIGKPGLFTQEERAEMEKHVVHGLEIINQSQLLKAAVNVVEFHHEHYNGRGYPHGLQGKDTPLEARLFALVDVFDALTGARVYKPAFTLVEALDIMAKERGSHFDPYLFDRFIKLAPYFEHKLPREERALMAMLLEQLTPYLDQFFLGRPLFAPPKTSTWTAFCRSLINGDVVNIPRPPDKS
jgi:putative nucleotidyltransferase with HDIG domain